MQNAFSNARLRRAASCIYNSAFHERPRSWTSITRTRMREFVERASTNSTTRGTHETDIACYTDGPGDARLPNARLARLRCMRRGRMEIHSRSTRIQNGQLKTSAPNARHEKTMARMRRRRRGKTVRTKNQTLRGANFTTLLRPRKNSTT